MKTLPKQYRSVVTKGDDPEYPWELRRGGRLLFKTKNKERTMKEAKEGNELALRILNEREATRKVHKPKSQGLGKMPSTRQPKPKARTGRLISHSGRTTRQHRGSVIR